MDGLRITPASFADAMALQRAVAKAIKTTKIDLGELADSLTGDADFSQADIGSESIETIVKMILSVGMSKEITDCLFKCAEKALLNDNKIDPDFFEVPENREFYYPIMIEIAKVNISPFFKSLGTMFNGLTRKIKGNSREQK